MFLRRKRKRVDGVDYEYWALCESVRTASGPRQRVVATLGKLDDAEAVHEAGWGDVDALLEGRRPARQLDLDSSSPSPAPTWEVADLSNLRVERVREFGRAWLGLSLWRRLGLHQLLHELMPEGREKVKWADLAAVLTVSRFCGQTSELGIAEHGYETTALEDITGIDPKRINDDRLYRGLDQLGAHKKELCAHLMDRYRDWFGVQFEFLLYDVTSTFFEGQANETRKPPEGTAVTAGRTVNKCASAWCVPPKVCLFPLKCFPGTGWM